MPNYTDLAGLTGIAVAASAALLLLPGIARLPRLHQSMLQGAVFVLMLIPFGEMPLAAYLRGATGDLSITTLLLVWCVLLRSCSGCGTKDTMSRQALLALVALAALALYPLGLGLGTFDPYRLGYGDPIFVIVLLLIALAGWFWKYHLAALCIVFAVYAWALGWYESDNLWDYLLDPWVAIYSLYVIAKHGIKIFLRRDKEHEALP